MLANFKNMLRIQKRPSGLPIIVLTGLALAAAGSGVAAQDVERDVPYVPTPPETVEAMLEMADVGPGDVVYDLGSGDGRIVIAAVDDFGAEKAVGVDIDPVRVQESIANAEAADVSDSVEFHEGNVFSFDISNADVVTMYLLQSVNERLRPRMLSELDPGTHIVSHQFHMGEWKPDDFASEGGREIYFWVVPAQVAGEWNWQANGQAHSMELDQSFQEVSGTLQADGGQSLPIREAELQGRNLAFATAGEQPWRFEGRVTDANTIEGTMMVGNEQHMIVANRVN